MMDSFCKGGLACGQFRLQKGTKKGQFKYKLQHLSRDLWTKRDKYIV